MTDDRKWVLTWTWPWADKPYSTERIFAGLERMADRHDRRVVSAYAPRGKVSIERTPSKPSKHWGRKLGVRK